MGQDFNDLGKKSARAELPQKKKAVLVYEEKECREDQKEPTKFYGYRERYKSSDERNQVPNYAFMIYDVSKLTRLNNLLNSIIIFLRKNDRASAWFQ